MTSNVTPLTKAPLHYIGERGTPSHIVTDLFDRKGEIDNIFVVYKDKNGEYTTGWSLTKDEDMVFMAELLRHTIKQSVFNQYEEDSTPL